MSKPPNNMAVLERLRDTMYDAELRAWLAVETVRGAFRHGDDSTPSRVTGQTLVEWSLVTAVMALVGITAWQIVGTAVTDAINRTVGSLGRAGG